MSWSRIASPQDWEAYKVRTAVALGVDAAAVHWGSPPPEYPCLAVSTLTRLNMKPDGFKVVTCLVLPQDARDLLGLGEGGGAAGVVVPAAPGGRASDDTEFRRYVVANLFTIVSELASVGVTKPERYEEKFNAFLADVDQATVSQAANVGPSAIFRKQQDGDQHG